MLEKCYEGNIKSFNIYDNSIEMNGKIAKIDKSELVDDYLLALLYNWEIKEGYFEKNGVKFTRLPFTVIEIFENKDYEIEVKGREVVDIGANIGDSSIYFAVNGAKKVIAVEPLPSVYSELLKNIELNNLQNIIIPINAAVGSKEGEMEVPCNYEISDSVMYSTLSTQGNKNETCKAPKITLKKILDYVNDPYLLKMDCEGCEFDLILNEYSDVSVFENIILEYHSNIIGIPYYLLLNKLSNDYDCKVVGSKKVGKMYCKKRTE
ncbi:FkbM family methyltransferase [Sulfurisphaera ohwakuensis]|uniref:FkbM family methyltransferase n=1 Tax=Sulfurisphaera ohwakuensis TaxID=69656 RepID=A0A7J9S0E7_SULOH|nr:FkbM family methyltransferase [Sulfurisphaera ohwakuensis]MBB5254994.1 FkbM family methyltransferase [Sulfurisphaera ohwakuensis]